MNHLPLGSMAWGNPAARMAGHGLAGAACATAAFFQINPTPTV